MILDCILTACNKRHSYYRLIPLFISSCKHFYPNVDVKIIFINETIPTELEKYRDHIICFKKPENVSDVFISQYIRLLYPCLLDYKNGILITDIDDIPLSTTYFTKNIEQYDNDKWINYRDNSVWLKNHIVICWQVAASDTWREVMNINNIDDLNNRLIEVFSNIKYGGNHGGQGWTTDQKHLHNYIEKWIKKDTHFISLSDKKTGFNRFAPWISQKTDYNKIFNNIKNNIYSDYHIWRPYDRFLDFNNSLIKKFNLNKPFN